MPLTTSPSHPARRPGMTWLLCLGLLGGVGTLHGQEKAKPNPAKVEAPSPEVQKVIEQLRLRKVQIQGELRIKINGQDVVLSENGVEMAPATPPGPTPPSGPATLLWRNGESLTGTLAGVKDGTLLWQSSLFTAPLALDMSSLKEASLPAQTIRTEELFSVKLRDGSRLFGTPISLDGDTLKLRSFRHGEISLNFAEIVRLQRTRGAGLLYHGPDTSEGWRPTTGSTAKAEWRTQDGGTFGTQIWNRGTRADLDLPQKVDVLLRISSLARPPEFTFTLGNTGTTSQLSVENWSGTLVLTQGSRFVPLRDLGSDRTVSIRLLWDRAQNRALAFTPEGEPLAVLQPPSAAAPPTTPGDSKPATSPSRGVQLRNNGTDLTLDELRVREWSGELPRPTKANGAHVELISGKLLEGKLVSLSGGKVTLASGEQVALEDIESLFTGVASTPTGSPSAAVLAYGDGTRLAGSLQSVNDGKVSMLSTASSSPISAPLDGLQRILFDIRPAEGAEPEPPFAKQDTLVAGKVTLHGKVLGAGSAQPRWLPVGGRESVEVAPTAQPVFTRVFVPETVSPPAALVYLENGDVLPAEVRAMDATSLHVSSPISGVREMPSAQVQAVQFGGRKIEMKGFTDPGWRQVRGPATSLERDATKVIFRQAAGLAHPSILQGDEVKFSLTAEDGWGALRVRIFTGGGDEPAGGIPLLLYLSGNELYAGQESDRGGDFFNQIQIRVTPNQPVNIRIALREKDVEMFANGVSICKVAIAIAQPAPADARQAAAARAQVIGGGGRLLVLNGAIRGRGTAAPSKVLGPGLVLETVSLWGNGEQPVGVRDFSVRPNPMRPWMPAVDPEAKDQTLTLPRFRSEDPPTHVLVALNGDVLRGRLEAATAESLRVISGLEPLTIPRERVAAVIRLLPADKPAPPAPATSPPAPAPPSSPVKATDPAPKPEPSAPKPKANPEPPANPNPNATHWILLTDGGRFGLKVERFDADKIVGTSTLLGRCEVPWDRIHTVRHAAPEPTTAQASYRDWKLKLAPEPVLPEGGGQNAPLLGTEVKTFKLPLLAGGEFDYAKNRGKIVILDFWATWCGPCIQSMPELMQTVASLKSDETIADKLVFIAVNQGEPEAQIKRFLETRGWTLPVGVDLLQTVNRQFQIEGIPNTVLIGPDGKVAWQEVGFRPGAFKDLAELIKKLATEKPAP